MDGITKTRRMKRMSVEIALFNWVALSVYGSMSTYDFWI
jgi:hypothetical protein